MSRPGGDFRTRDRDAAWFFMIALGWSWLFWGAAAALAGQSVWDSPARWLVYIGGVGPLLAAVVITATTEGRRGLWELGARIVDARRVPARWMAVALLLPVCAMAAAVAVAAGAGALPAAVDASRLVELAGSPHRLASFALFVLIFGPVPEEIGWRGFALDALQARRSALAASLLLGAAWALWHAPLFVIAGYYGDGPPPDPLHFTVAILGNSVLHTWAYNHTRRSVLVAICFHFMVNFVGMLVEGDGWVEWTRTGFTIAAAVAAVWISGAATLGARRSGPIAR
jgi:uncharacterized protein